MAKILECVACDGHFVEFNKLTEKVPTDCPECSAPLAERAEFFSAAESRLQELERMGMILVSCESDEECESNGHRDGSER